MNPALDMPDLPGALCAQTDPAPLRKPRIGLDITSRLNDSAFSDRFWSKVDRSGDCWTWTAHRNRSGYGQFTVVKGQFTTAHRVAWAVTNGGLIPPGAHICHTCDNPPCVRPEHLFLGDARTNALDMVSKGRANALQGEQSSAARLTDEDVRRIRRQPYRYGLWIELARQYGVSSTAIRNVHQGKTWRHVA